jgi:hypothetical protein
MPAQPNGEFSTYSPLKRLKREAPHPKKWEYPEISTVGEVGSLLGPRQASQDQGEQGNQVKDLRSKHKAKKRNRVAIITALGKD